MKLDAAKDWAHFVWIQLTCLETHFYGCIKKFLGGLGAILTFNCNLIEEWGFVLSFLVTPVVSKLSDAKVSSA